ncbi:hypothetical protein KR009_008452, partial [Drosophila setifemur]
MRSVSIILLIALSCLALAEGMAERCPRPCTRDLNPVCAVWRRGNRVSRCTFANECVLKNQRCRTGQS